MSLYPHGRSPVLRYTEFEPLVTLTTVAAQNPSFGYGKLNLPCTRSRQNIALVTLAGDHHRGTLTLCTDLTDGSVGAFPAGKARQSVVPPITL